MTVWAREEPTNKNHTIFALQVALNSLAFFKDYFNTDEPVPPKTGMLIDKRLTIRSSWLIRSFIRTGFFFRCDGKLGFGFLPWRSYYIRWDSCIDFAKTTTCWNYGSRNRSFLYVFHAQLNSRVSSTLLGFGNYVTCKWWDDLWLNEAMATWLSFKPFGVYYPDWNLVKVLLPIDDQIWVFCSLGIASINYGCGSSDVGWC